MSTRLSLRIHKVKCVDETNGKWVEKVGNDEIYLGGFVVAENGNTTAIPPISIYPHFDDGDVKTFNPPKVFHTINLPAGNWEQPKGFGIGLTLIEKDAGGMASAVSKIADFAEKKIKERLAQGEAPRTASASAAAAVSPLIIIAIEWAAPHVFDYVRKKLMAAINDDIFTPQIATLSLPSSSFTWSGSTDSAEKTVRFRNHGGVYDLTYDWKLN